MPADQEEIHRLSLSEDKEDRAKAIVLIENEFENLPDKYDAWNDLIRLVNDEIWSNKVNAINFVSSAFKYLPDKSIAWSDFIRLVGDEDKDIYINFQVSYLLFSAFKYTPNKYVALSDLHRLTIASHYSVREIAACILGRVFPSISEEYKYAAWSDLHILTCDLHYEVRRKVIHSLAYAFEHIPEEQKSEAWEDLHRLTSDEDDFVRSNTPDLLSIIFSSFPEECKFLAWEDLHRLTNDEYCWVRTHASSSLGVSFKYIPDKSVAFSDLHRLTSDESRWVKESVVYALFFAFENVPDKSTAYSDIVRLKSDPDSCVRTKVAEYIGSYFSSIPDEYKSAVLSDLHSLLIDGDTYVRMYAYYSLGKISIHEASKSSNEADSRILLDKAIQYFEKSVKEGPWESPATFCSFFYRSFNDVLFKKVHPKNVEKDYIAAAKIWSRDSETKHKLIEAVEQLSKALEIAYDARESGSDWQETLKRCSDICNYAEQLMNDNKDKTPAAHSLYKIAKPSFDKRITELIDKLKETADIAYDKSRNTPAEPIASFIKEEIYGWRVENQVQMEKSLNNLLFSLKTQIPNIPETKFIYEKIDEIKSYKIVEDQIAALISLIPLILQMSIESKLNIIIENQNKTFDKVTQIDKTTSDTNETVTRTESKVDSILQTVTELKEIASKLKAEGNEKGSQDVNDIADKIKVLLENKDPKEMTLFIEKLQKEVPDIFEEIEKSTAPKDVKEKAKIGLKDKMMETGKSITFAVATNWIATYLPSIITAGVSGLLVPGIILAVLVSIVNLRNQDLK